MKAWFFPIYSWSLVNDQYSTYSNFIEEEDGKTHCITVPKTLSLIWPPELMRPLQTNDSTTYSKFADLYLHVLYYQCLLTNEFSVILTSIPT